VPRTLGHRPYTHSTGNFVLFVSFSIIFRQKSLDYLLTWCADPEKERWRECDRRGRKYTVNILKINCLIERLAAPKWKRWQLW